MGATTQNLALQGSKHAIQAPEIHRIEKPLAIELQS